MRIIDSNLTFKSLSSLGKVTKITLHHAEAKKCSVEDIHRWHLTRGWSGIGYHFFIRKDGSIYRGRPEDKLGAHTAKNNTGNIGICFEGGYMTETMPQAQINAGIELVNHLCSKYGLSKSNVYKHKDLSSTDCPGTNFPFSDIVNGQATSQPTPEPSKPQSNNWIARLQAECNRQGFSNQRVDGIAGPNTLKGCPMLQWGVKGNITKLLQERLVEFGYNPNGIDGKYGNGTRNAVVKFQRDKGLASDGIVGSNTWRKLLKM